MCKTALLAACLLASAKGLQAQELRTLPPRIDSARLASEAARRALESYRKGMPKNRIRWSDSAVIASGRIKVYFHESAGPYARPGIAESESQLASLGSFVSRLPELEFSIGPDSALTPFDRRRDGMIMVRHHTTPTTANITSTYPDPGSIAQVIVGKATEIAVSRSQPELIRWRNHALPLGGGSKVDWGVLRLDVVSSASPLGRRCHGGDIPACRLFLGFEKVDDPLTAYYDAAGWRALIRENRDHATRANGTQVRRCEAGEDAACLSVLRLMSDWRAAPATDYARMTLLARALSLGGDRSAERLLTATGTAADAVAAAARVPIDTVIAAWQRDVRERAAASSNVSIPVVVSSILAIAVFLFLSLRSTRWR